MSVHSTPGENIYYTVRCGLETTAVRIVCADSFESCGPWANLDLTHFIWTTFAYYCTNYAIVVLPLRTSGEKIVDVCHYKAKIGGEDSRTCRRFFWDYEDPRMFCNIQCQKPNRCTCTLCCKQPLSLKTLASKIVFGLDNRHKFCFNENTTYSEYVSAVQSGVNLLTSQSHLHYKPPYFIQFDDFSLGQFHENCSLDVIVQGNGKWFSSSQCRFETHEEFNLVLHCKTQFWCTFCEKSLFLLPRRIPYQRFKIWECLDT